MERFVVQVYCSLGSGPRYQILSHVAAVARVKKPTAMRESHAIRVTNRLLFANSVLFACYSRMPLGFLTRATCTIMPQCVTLIIYLGPLPMITGIAVRKLVPHNQLELPQQTPILPCLFVFYCQNISIQPLERQIYYNITTNHDITNKHVI